ncbi:hypothetical protein CL620_02890 [archaeon]|nr:hypothetical protein [archaeon]
MAQQSIEERLDIWHAETGCTQHEQISLREISFLTICGVTLSVLVWITSFLPSPAWILVSLFLYVSVLTLASHIVPKFGVSIGITFIFSVGTFMLTDLGVVGWHKVLVLFLGAFFFEVVLVMSTKLPSPSFGMIIAAVVAAGSIPLLTALSLSPSLALTLPIPLLNLILFAALIGLASGICMSITWIWIRQMKPIVKLRGYMGTLVESVFS